MAWVRIDDHFDEHPKLAKVGPLGWGIWLAGLSYCNRNLTDGFIPRSKAHILASFDVVDEESGQCWQLSRTNGMAGDDIDASWIVAILVNAGIWDEVPGGYQIHDYSDYQPTKAHILEERERKIAAGKAGGQASAEARAKAAAKGRRKAPAQPESNPKPNPVPSVSEETERKTIAAKPPAPLPESGPSQQIVKAFCDAVGIDRPVNYSKSVGQAKQLAGAGITPEQIPDIVVWLRDQKWVNGAIDLGLIVNQADKWQAARKPAPRDGQSREAREGRLVF